MERDNLILRLESDRQNAKFEKQAGRTAVRSHQRPRSSAMQVGALAQRLYNGSLHNGSL